LGAAILLAAITAAPNAPAVPAPGLMLPPDVASSPAWKYAGMDAAACETELGKRGIAFTKVSAAAVAAPVRLSGPIRGVTFHSQLPTAQRATSPYEIFDCRLVLALDDFAVILGKYDVSEVVHFSVYRPPIKSWPQDAVGKQHTGGLAIDAGVFIRKDGSILQVERDFHGAIGATHGALDRVECVLHVDHQIHLRADGLAHRGDDLDDTLVRLVQPLVRIGAREGRLALRGPEAELLGAAAPGDHRLDVGVERAHLRLQ
jgi:hypothetical protein